MFSEKRKSRRKAKTTDYSKEQNKIAKGTVFTGNITSEGAFRIEGIVEGNLKTNSKVVLSETGKITGDLECDQADIEGVIKGKVTVKNILSLKSTSFVEGEITTGELLVEPGANLNGNCTMKSTVKTLQNEQKGKSKPKRKTKTA